MWVRVLGSAAGGGYPQRDCFCPACCAVRAVPAAASKSIHINNTNPILLEDARERRILEQHGIEVAVDGLELQI